MNTAPLTAALPAWDQCPIFIPQVTALGNKIEGYGMGVWFTASSVAAVLFIASLVVGKLLHSQMIVRFGVGSISAVIVAALLYAIVPSIVKSVLPGCANPTTTSSAPLHPGLPTTSWSHRSSTATRTEGQG